MHKILFWSGFGIAVRLWQMGIEMRPPLTRYNAWAYPFYGAVGGGFGYWLTGVEERQFKFINDRKAGLLEKRKRRAEREGVDGQIDGAVGAAMGGESEESKEQKGGFRLGWR